MPDLTIVANITAHPDKIDLVKAELIKLIDVTRAEEGCINYDLHQDNENPAHFLERNVKIDAHEDTLTGDIKVANTELRHLFSSCWS